MHKAQLKLLRFPASAAPLVARSPKTMVPRQGERIFARKRLFVELDNRLGRGHLWIGGPPGAGKTVLAANYSDQTSMPVSWYELDPLDTDLVSFFATFPQAFFSASSSPPVDSSLPKLLPENMLALPIFARKFFRKLFAGLSEKHLLILDNFQEIPEDSPLIALLVICLQELPVNWRAIILSRKPPPPAFARMKVAGSLQVADPDMLRFNRQEIGKVMTLHGLTEEQENCIDYLNKTTAGWAAGLTLLLKEQNREICAQKQDGELEHQELFDYFAGVIFAGLSDKKQQLLMSASLLPEIRPKILDQITGQNASREYFTQLNRDNFFTYALDRHGQLFQYHPLFREFLRRKAYAVMPAADRTGLLEQAADFFIAKKRPVAAVDLLIQAKSRQRGIRLIRKIGTSLVKQGRFKTLLRWQQALPREIVQADPWLLFFFGVATTAFDPQKAIGMLKTSFLLFREQDKTTGALLACSSLTNSIINHLSDLSALDPWLDFLEEQLDPFTFPDNDCFENIAISNAIFRALVLRRPAHPDLESWLQVVVRQGGMHPALITHYLWTGRFTEARSALDRIYANQEQIGSQLQLSAIKAMEVQYYLIMAEKEKCVEVIQESLHLIKETGIRVWEVHFLILGAGCCLNCGDPKKAAGYLQAVEEKMDQARLLERSYYHVVKTLDALLIEDLIAADRHQQSALDMAAAIGMPSYATWCWYGSALVAVFQENYQEAVFRFERVFAHAASPGNPWFTCQAHLGMAYMYLQRKKRDKAVYHLREGFSLAREKNYLTFFFFLPKMMEILAVAALEENIEPTFICRFIEHWRLTPCNPPVHLANWPWPLQIFTLGRFSILRHGKKLDATARAKNKPILLLQAIIALGGRQVSKTRLADIFWPQSNGDEQAAALKINLHRLRQLLDVRDAVLQTSSYLTLNPRVCWVDSWQFERLAGKVLSNNSELQNRLKVKQQAVAGYHGDFLPALQDEPWTFGYRQRLRHLFRQLD